MKKVFRYIIVIIITAFSNFFLWKKLDIDGNNILYTIIAIMIFYFINDRLKNIDRRKYIITFLLAFVFSSIEVIGEQINNNFSIESISLINYVGYFIFIFFTTLFVFDIFKINFNIFENRIDEKCNKNYIIYTILILICWMPYFFRYFPGLLTSDSCAQVAQAIGLTKLTNHHPIFHTGIISIFVNLGVNVFGNINYGVAIYTMVQMTIMAISFAYVLNYLYKNKVPFFIRIFALIYYMLYPINALFSVTMWKDILFAGIIPIFVIQCDKIVKMPDKFIKDKIKIIMFMVVSILVCYLRNNGVYIVFFTILFLFIIERKYWKKMGGIFAGTLIIFFITKNIIFGIFNVSEGNIGEMLSIPLQQIARVEKYHKENIDINTIYQINKFFNVENIGEKYNPVLSDPVKAEFKNDVFKENKVEFIKLWGKLFLRYPKDYIESFLSNSYGYYYPEAKHWVANRTMEANNMGLEQTPLIEGKIVSKIDSLIERRDIPIVSMFFSIGFAVWLTVICMAYMVYSKRYVNLVMFIPIFVLWLTIIASPVFCEYRYAYPIFTTLPIYICLCFRKNLKGEKE